MSEYLDEALWRENYRDLTTGVRMIREAVEQSFGSPAPLPNSECLTAPIQECQHIAQAIYNHAAKMQCRVSQLEKRLKEHGLADAA